MQDPHTIASGLVEEITNTVHRRFRHRRGVLVPPRLTGRCPITSMKIGEEVMDRVDALLDEAMTDWPGELNPDIYIDLISEGKAWQLEWVVDTAGDADADAEPHIDAEAEGEGE